MINWVIYSQSRYHWVIFSQSCYLVTHFKWNVEWRYGSNSRPSALVLMTNYQLSQNLQVLGNSEFNHLTTILTNLTGEPKV